MLMLNLRVQLGYWGFYFAALDVSVVLAFLAALCKMSTIHVQNVENLLDGTNRKK